MMMKECNLVYFYLLIPCMQHKLTITSMQLYYSKHKAILMQHSVFMTIIKKLKKALHGTRIEKSWLAVVNECIYL